jgi:hypothetical protein
MEIERLIRTQGGVLSRRQVVGCGGDDNLIERMVRRRIWQPVHPGVYVNHTGKPSAEQKRMGAVLYAWPAALAGESALLAHGVRNVEAAGVTVAIDGARRVRPQPGMRVVRLTNLADRVLWNLNPPRIRLELAILQVASERWLAAGEAAAVALLGDVCQQRRTTPARLLEAVEGLPCLHGRAFVAGVLADVASGAFSVLERRYLTHVERAHGLPRARRQSPVVDQARRGFRDVLYEEQRLVIELDGRLGHEWATDQWADLERDLRAATGELLTVRLGWGAVVDPCRLAPLVGELLQVRGWRGSPRRCRRCRVA